MTAEQINAIKRIGAINEIRRCIQGALHTASAHIARARLCEVKDFMSEINGAHVHISTAEALYGELLSMGEKRIIPDETF